MHDDRRTGRLGLAIAGVTACVSGVAVFVNGYGVRRFGDATVYTTAKNLVAALALGGVSAVLWRRGLADAPRRPGSRSTWLGLGVVAVIGGSVPFVLFFEGLSRASTTDAAFLHKTLVVWVALLAPAFLHERLTGWHALAVVALVAGQAAMAGGLDVGRGSGEAMILGATLLWAAEVVLARRLLAAVPSQTVALARMGGGSVVLVAWVAVTGRLGDLTGISASGWLWAAATGGLLAAYVATWFAALARARAVDVTAILVLAALVTAVLDSAVRGAPWVPVTGVVLLVVGAAAAVLAGVRAPVPAGERP